MNELYFWLVQRYCLTPSQADEMTWEDVQALVSLTALDDICKNAGWGTILQERKTVSYTFKVVVKDGKAEIGTPYITPPDGEYMVNGHTEDAWESIGVTRYENGSQVFQATAYSKRP